MTPDDTLCAAKPLAKRKRERQDPAERRRHLVAATVACLAKLGPRGATGREICRFAGVSHGLVRHYFSNPDNLLLETYADLCEQLLAHIEEKAKPDADEPWTALHHFFVATFNDDWASADIIGAWMAFWQLVRSREDFAAVSEAYNLRQRAIQERIVRRIPGAERRAPLADSIAILSAVTDGLWIEYYLSDARTPADRAVALCDLTARSIFGA